MSDPFSALPAKDRTPASITILNQWVNHAERIVGARGDRTRWVLASTIVTAALQRALIDQADAEAGGVAEAAEVSTGS